MAALTEDVKLLPKGQQFRAKALWKGDHPSLIDGFLTNYLGGFVRGTTHESLGGEIFGWLAFFRTVDTDTGKRRHEVLFPEFSWDDLLRHIGFDESAVKVWARAISENPDVSPEAVAKELRLLQHAKKPPAAAGKGGQPGNKNAAKQENDSCNARIVLPRDRDESTLRRMKRDLPDLAQQVVDGEISLNAAAIQAGYRKKKVQVEISAEGFLRAIRKHLTDEERQDLIDWLTEYRT